MVTARGAVLPWIARSRSSAVNASPRSATRKQPERAIISLTSGSGSTRAVDPPFCISAIRISACSCGERLSVGLAVFSSTSAATPSGTGHCGSSVVSSTPVPPCPSFCARRVEGVTAASAAVTAKRR